MAQRGRPRKSSVTVQMSEDPSELDALLAAANQPRPGRDNPDDPTPPPPDDLPKPADIPDEDPEEEPDEETPDEEDGEEVPSEDENGSPDEDDVPEEDRPADPPGTAAGAGATAAGAVPEPFPGYKPPPGGYTRYQKAVGLDGEIIPRVQRYESRISIVDAFQYPGSLAFAPDWVDRNWVAFADNYDPVRDMEPGPALRVPTYRGDTVLCRKGDYIARQEVKLTHDLPGELKIEVWEQDQFERLFIPAKPGAPEHVRPWDPNPDPRQSRSTQPPTLEMTADAEVSA